MRPLNTGKQMFVLFITLLTINITYGQENRIKEISLIEAIDIGLNQNHQIIAAREKISAAKGRYWSGITLPRPEIGVSYEFIPESKSLNNFSERTFEVSQSFEFPSNYFLKGSKYNREEETAFQQLKLTEIIITGQIKSAYFNVLAKKELFEISEENFKITGDFYNKAEIRYNVGEGTNLERLTAKVQLTEASNNSEISANQLKTAYAELNFALGYGQQAEENLILTDSLVFSELDLSEEELFKQALSLNQNIRISELNLSTSSIDKTLAWSSLLPEFNVSYFKQNRDGDNGFYGAAFGISVPLWFLFEQRGQIQEASANKNIAESELEIVKNETALKLKSAFNEYENNLKQVRLYKTDILPQAEEIYRSALASYGAGEITYIEFLQARQTLINAKSNYVNILFNYNLSIISLEEISGTGLTTTN